MSDTKNQSRDTWLKHSRKAVELIREVRKLGLGNPQYSDEMRREMEEFVRRVAKERADEKGTDPV